MAEEPGRKGFAAFDDLVSDVSIEIRGENKIAPEMTSVDNTTSRSNAEPSKQQLVSVHPSSSGAGRESGGKLAIGLIIGVIVIVWIGAASKNNGSSYAPGPGSATPVISASQQPPPGADIPTAQREELPRVGTQVPQRTLAERHPNAVAHERAATERVKAPRQNAEPTRTRDITWSANRDSLSRYRYTSLFDAVGVGERSDVVAMIQDGADVNLRSRGSNPLIEAVRRSRYDVVELLLDAGADPNTSDSYDRSALAWAFKRADSQMISLLKLRGALK